METAKRTRLDSVPRQRCLLFETEVTRALSPAERQAVTIALAGLLIAASGLAGEDDNES